MPHSGSRKLQIYECTNFNKTANRSHLTEYLYITSNSMKNGKKNAQKYLEGIKKVHNFATANGKRQGTPCCREN